MRTFILVRLCLNVSEIFVIVTEPIKNNVEKISVLINLSPYDPNHTIKVFSIKFSFAK